MRDYLNNRNCIRFENCFTAIPSEILSHNCCIQLNSINYQLKPSKEKSSLSLNSDVKYDKYQDHFASNLIVFTHLKDSQ